MPARSKKFLVNEHTAGLRGGLRAYSEDIDRKVGSAEIYTYDSEETAYIRDRDDGAPTRSKIDQSPRDRDARH